MTYPTPDSARHNRILAALPLADYTGLAQQLSPVDLVAGQFLGQPGKPVEHVYFPTTCTTSLVSTTQDGETSELAMVGRDGLIGVSLVLGGAVMNHRVMVQSGGRAWRMSAFDFQSALNGCRPLQQLALCHVQALITQMAQSIVCSRHHAISERLSYWLLCSLEVLPTHELRVTHENIASMLGVRRESVTQALGKFQADGWVSNSRGKITVHDREGLASQVCECFDLVKSETQRLFQRALQPESSSHGLNGLAAWGDAWADTRAETWADGDGFQASDAQAPMPTDAQQALLQKYQDVYDFAPVGFATLDAQGCVMDTNLAGAILLGLQRSQHQRPLLVSLLDARSREAFAAFLQEVQSGKCRRHCEVQLPSAMHRGDVTLRIDATVDESGEELRLVMTDISEAQKQWAQALAQQTCQQALLDHSPFMLWSQDEAGCLVAANAPLRTHLANLGQGVAGPDGLTGQALPAWLQAAPGEGAADGWHERAFWQDGQERWLELRHAQQPWPGQAGLQQGRSVQLGYARDITERKLQEQRLRSLATLDSLTELPNRRYFMSRMDEMYSALRRDPSQQAFLVLLDLDHFKTINDQFGHAAGDGVLHDFARRLQTCFRDSDCVARLGGDEFGVLLQRTDTVDGQLWADRVCAQITGTAFDMGTQSIRLQVSLGVSPLWPTDDSAQAAMLRADQALYRAKAPVHAVCAADVPDMGYPQTRQTPDLFAWAAQGQRGVSAQPGAGR